MVSARGQSFKDTVLSVLTFYQDKLSRGGVRALFEVRQIWCDWTGLDCCDLVF